MMKSGFMLIEVMLASLIAAMIGTVLFVCFWQVNSYVPIVQDYVDISTKAAIFHRQLERDLTGFFIPIASEKIKEDKKSPAGTQTKAPEEKEKKEPVKRVTKIFYGNNREKNLDTLTFITNNPVQVYWSAKAGKAKPRVARVVYRLVKDKEAKNSYKLMRQEGYDLYYDAYKKGGTKEIREYEMIDGIKSLTIEYAVAQPPKEEGSSAKEKKEYKMIKEWKGKQDEEKNEGKEQEKKEQKKLFPDYVTITIALWDTQKKRDTKFVFTIPLIAQGEQPAEIKQESIVARLLGEAQARQQQPGQTQSAQTLPGQPAAQQAAAQQAPQQAMQGAEIDVHGDPISSYDFCPIEYNELDSVPAHAELLAEIDY